MMSEMHHVIKVKTSIFFTLWRVQAFLMVEAITLITASLSSGVPLQGHVHAGLLVQSHN